VRYKVALALVRWAIRLDGSICSQIVSDDMRLWPDYQGVKLQAMPVEQLVGRLSMAQQRLRTVYAAES